MEIKLLGKRILVEPIKEEEKEAIIVLPDSAKKKPIVLKGKVVVVGSEVDLANVTVGDTVFYYPAYGTNFEVEDVKLTLLNVDEILGVKLS